MTEVETRSHIQGARPRAAPVPFDVAGGRRLAAVGAICTLLFAVVHVYWAAGGRIGLDAAIGAIGDRPLFLAYDIAAALLFVAVAAGAMLLAGERGSHRLRSRLATAMLWGGAIALMRGVPLGLIPDAIAIDRLDVGALYDVCFTLGGLIFVRAALLLRAAR